MEKWSVQQGIKVATSGKSSERDAEQEYMAEEVKEALMEIPREIGTSALRGTAKSALELSLKTGEYLVSLKIENSWVVGVCGVGVIGLAAFYIHRKYPKPPAAERRAAELAAENPIVSAIVVAIRNVLERNEAGENNPEVMLIENGSLLVELVCHTEESLQTFLDDFKEQRIKQRLEKEFRKLGCEEELQVTITNLDEGRRNLNENRSVSGLASGPETSESRSSTAGAIVPLKFECERPEVLKLAAQKYLQNIKRSSPNGFVRHLQEKLKVHIIDVRCGSLIVTVECSSREIFEALWEDYTSGNINKVANKYLVTEEILVALGLGVGVLLTTTIPVTKYAESMDYFAKKALQEATTRGISTAGRVISGGIGGTIGSTIGGFSGLVGISVFGGPLAVPVVGAAAGLFAGFTFGQWIFGRINPTDTPREDPNE